jgi:glycosyltransferase involved in cell wall biosynthesis
LLVSVLTATFNRRATFLPQCLDSVRHQVGDGFTGDTDDGARAELRARRGNRGS